jgi:hypothetical protein
MKYMITGGELRGESESIDADELNRRIRFHQQKSRRASPRAPAERKRWVDKRFGGAR